MHLRTAREAQGPQDGPGAVGAAGATGGDGFLSSTTAATSAASLSTVSPSVTSPAAEAASEGGGGAGGSSNSSSLNVTAHFLDDDVEDYGFSEMQTVALACIATLIPLFIILVAAFAIRFLWRKFRPRLMGEADGDAVAPTADGGSRGYDGVLQRGESAEGAKAGTVGGGGASGTGSGAHLLLLMPDELKTSESQFSVTPGELDDVTSQSPLISGSACGKGGGVATVSNHKGLGTSKSANGSVITMTLQNNHLIVETEELASLPMADDVEPSPPHALASSVEDTAQIHHPPPSAAAAAVVEFRRAAPEEDLLDDEEEEEEVGGDLEGIAEEDEEEVAAAERAAEEEARRRKRRRSSRRTGGDDGEDDEEEGGLAGLSQSDLSESSSIGSSNPTYRYGNQLGYASGHFGYPQYAGYEPPKATTSSGCGPSGESGPKRAPEAGGGGWRGEEVNGEAEDEEEEEEEERRHQRVQEELGSGAEATKQFGHHHRTGSLPKAADDSVAAIGGGLAGGMSEADKLKCSKRRSLPIITHTPASALGGFKKLLNEEEDLAEEDLAEAGGGEGGRRRSKDGGKKKEEVLKEVADGELEVAEKEAPGSRGASDGAAPTTGDGGTNSGEHENQAFVETD